MFLYIFIQVLVKAQVFTSGNIAYSQSECCFKGAISQILDTTLIHYVPIILHLFTSNVLHIIIIIEILVGFHSNPTMACCHLAVLFSTP